MQENPTFISENSEKSALITSKKEKVTAFLFSVVALLLVVGFGGVMMFLKFTTNNAINHTQMEIQKADEKISQYQKQKDIIIASFMQDNTLFHSLNLKQLVADFRQAAKDSNVQFQGFSVKNNTISTNLIATSATQKDAVASIIEMMKNYSQNNQQKAFALDPILSISGTPNARMTPVTFKIISVKNSENSQK